jgi:hypothetical protein
VRAFRPRPARDRRPAEERVVPLVHVTLAEGARSKAAYEATGGTPITRQDLVTQAPVRTGEAVEAGPP